MFLRYFFPNSDLYGYKHTGENLFVLVLFVLSMRSTVMGYVLLAGMVILAFSGASGCIKALLILSVRQILSTRVAVVLPGAKLYVVLIIGVLLVLSTQGRVTGSISAKVKSINILLFLFAAYCAVSSLMNSSYPIASVLKVSLFYICLLGLMNGTAATSYGVDWICYLNNLFTPIMVASAIVIPIGSFRLVNSTLQGIITHPNMLGIMTALFTASLLCDSTRPFIVKAILVSMNTVMCYLSASRTGMFTIIACLGVYYSLSSGARTSRKILIGVGIVVAGVVLLTSYSNEINSFIYKSDTTNLFASRDIQILQFQEKFNANPIFGTGFMAPYVQGIRDWSKYNFVNEPGNLIFVLLGDCGIIGFVLFVILLLFFLSGRYVQKDKIVLLLAPIMVSMGEMILMSPNNMACIAYVMMGMFICCQFPEEML